MRGISVPLAAGMLLSLGNAAVACGLAGRVGFRRLLRQVFSGRMPVTRMTSASVAYILISSAIATTCPASPKYTVVDIGTIEGGSYGGGINNRGEVAGWSYVNGSGSPSVAYYWKNGSMTRLATLGVDSRALDINDNGEILGWSRAYPMGGGLPCLWKNGTISKLVSNDYAVYYSAHINNNSQIVYSTGYGTIMLENGVQTSLPIAGANSISDNGRIVGYDSGRAVMYWQGTVWDVGTLPQYTQGGAYDVNDQGQVVGWSTTNGVNGHAFFWQDSTMVDMGTLGGTYSRAYAINSLGTAVGYSGLAGSGQHAFIWQNGVMTDLNSLIPTGYADWLEFGVDINASGQILASGWKNGIAHSYVLTPVPEPSTVISLISGIGFLVILRRRGV